jgi:hypothetical protein
MNYTRTFWFTMNVLFALIMLSSGLWIGFLNVCTATWLFADWLDEVT